ncbi:WYL domain-containing protein [uncultured Fibrobacter sp.]|uniref:WYL domain-containing protein n=1 Tax=uncultured Fibrobacter sp. TaxID=261512 RepID=UPI0026130F6E|nr:WYL domain-containing protein [uncultured Fibrobacter sp.]
MPTNKNAFLRIRILDGLLSESAVRHYTMSQMIELCNKKLKDSDEEIVGRRCIEKDLKFIQEVFGTIEKTRSGKNTIIHYANRTDSIFNQKISSSELKLLQAVIRTVGQMDGLENFGFLGKLEESTENPKHPSIIFEKNEFLSRRDLLPKLISFIERKKTIEIEYHPIHSKKINKIELYPQLLKQYNARWFLFGLAMDKKKILTFSLEQLDNVKESSKKYESSKIDWNEYFDDMIGVSKKDNEKPQEIIFWASKKECTYLEGKPIHASQKMLKKKNADEMRQKYRIPEDGGNFFSINCIVNFELKREMASKFGERLVLEPESLRNEIIDDVKKMMDRYGEIKPVH